MKEFEITQTTTTMQKRWLIRTAENNTTIDAFRSKLKVDRIVAQLLLQRGISTFEEAELFFRPKLSHVHDPFLMKDLPEACARINDAMKRKERIMLLGDYDVDGTSSVALMYAFLKTHYSAIDYYIPDRYTEGYGISFQGIDHAIATGVGLIIALDCGTRSIEHVAYAKGKGVDFIVCDHHTPGSELPDCLLLNPKQSACDYPFKELSGCGVGFKLLEGLCALNGWDHAELYKYLDLLAISIGADLVPVTGENRIFCYHGLKQLNDSPRKAFVALIAIAKREFPLTLTDVVFTIAPRINAAGRIRSGRHAVELMISDNEEEIQRLAIEIDVDNTNRRALDEQITKEALELIEGDPREMHRKSTVVFKKDWHKGVVGIVASRLIEKHFKPTIVLTESNGRATGSARTVNNFDIHQALMQCEHLLEQFGGHTHAAGMTLTLENVPKFQALFEEVVQNSLSLEDQSPEEVADLEISLGELFAPGENRMKIPRLKRILEQFEPHGPGNMKPVFLVKNVFTTETRLLKDAHLKLKVVQPNSDVALDAIGFNLGSKLDVVVAGLPFDMLCTLESNRWNNRETLQLNIKDVRPSV